MLIMAGIVLPDRFGVGPTPMAFRGIAPHRSFGRRPRSGEAELDALSFSESGDKLIVGGQARGARCGGPGERRVPPRQGRPRSPIWMQTMCEEVGVCYMFLEGGVESQEGV